MLKQSIEEQKRSPVLWYGRLVDFGSFNETLNTNATNNSISIGFALTVPLDDVFLYNQSRNYYNNSIFEKTIQLYVDIVITGNSDGSSSYVSGLRLRLYDVECKINYKNNGEIEAIEVGDSIYKVDNIRQFTRIGKLLPITAFYKEQIKKKDDIEEKILVPYDYLEQQLIQEVRQHLHGLSNAQDFSKSFPLRSKSDLFIYMKRKTNLKKWDSFTDEISTIKDKRFLKIHELVLLSKLFTVIEATDREIGRYFNNVKYIEPIRATALRYYRKQDLRIDEIDSRGSNVPHFLESLSATEKESFSEWVNKHLQVKFSAESITGHIALTVTDESNKLPVNIADTGFGYSQVLPVIVQLWCTINKKTRSKQRNVNRLIIEQPELHLHPYFQAKLADMLVDVINSYGENKSNISIVIETHSSQLINRLGALINDKKISQDDVGIFIFDKNPNSETIVTTSTFDENGVLVNWPSGFFDPILE